MVEEKRGGLFLKKFLAAGPAVAEKTGAQFPGEKERAEIVVFAAAVTVLAATVGRHGGEGGTTDPAPVMVGAVVNVHRRGEGSIFEGKGHGPNPFLI
jgi:hypothetical protein